MSAATAPALAAVPSPSPAPAPALVSAPGDAAAWATMRAAVAAAAAANAHRKPTASAAGTGAGASAGDAQKAQGKVQFRIRTAEARDAMNIWVTHIRSIRDVCCSHYSAAETAIWSAPERKSHGTMLKRFATHIFLVAERVDAFTAAAGERECAAGAGAAANASSGAAAGAATAGATAGAALSAAATTGVGAAAGVGTAVTADDVKRAAETEAAVLHDAMHRDNPILGFAELDPTPCAQPRVPVAPGGGEATLVAAYVSPDHTGAGVGRALVTEVLTRFRARRDAGLALAAATATAAATAAAAAADGKSSAAAAEADASPSAAAAAAAAIAAARCSHVYLDAALNAALFYPKFGFQPVAVVRHTFTNQHSGAAVDIAAVAMVLPL